MLQIYIPYAPGIKSRTIISVISFIDMWLRANNIIIKIFMFVTMVY
jgi:hypothetical protein